MRPAIAASILCVSLCGYASSATAQSSGDVRALARTVAAGYLDRARTAERDGRPIAAEGLFTRAVDADRSFLDAYLGLARVLVARGRTAEAARILELASLHALSNDDDTARWARAMAEMGAIDAAIASIEHRGHTARAQRLAAELCAAASRLPEALAHARRSLELTAGDPDAERDARRLVRALALLVGEGDPVRYPGAGASAFRRLLAR
ncbi:MAG: tetratricopeptide repeat protein [Myxococcales bacterium]|nr:tetratricopeptide repeat protein [Myxococcales bacterium]